MTTKRNKNGMKQKRDINQNEPVFGGLVLCYEFVIGIVLSFGFDLMDREEKF